MNIKQRLKRSKAIYKIWQNIHSKIYMLLYLIDPRLTADRYYSKHHGGAKPNLDSPQTLEEKNIWLALRTDTEIWSMLSDKYAVRKYIEYCGESQILNMLYCKCDSVKEIDFNKLPQKFVIKSNNGCGTVMIIENKSKMDELRLKRIIRKWLKERSFGYIGYNGHYLRIKPCIIIEKSLQDAKGNLPIDYKLFCSYGEVFLIEVCLGRSVGQHDVHARFYDTDWNVVYDNGSSSENDIKKPETFDEMVRICGNLAGKFPFVRVDFYEVEGDVIFGELTFTPGFVNFTDSMNLKYGSYVDLSGLV